MTREEYDAFVLQVDRRLGSLAQRWEGPEPHDFRDMQTRGVRFVHSELFAKLPGEVMAPAAERAEEYVDAGSKLDFAPGGMVQFKVLVGDDQAADLIGRKLQVWGYQFERVKQSDYYDALMFSVAVSERHTS